MTLPTTGSKPVTPALHEPPDDTKLSLHKYESNGAWLNFLREVSFLQRVTKFTPTFYAEGLETGCEETTEESYGTYGSNAYYRSYRLRGIVRDDVNGYAPLQRYFDLHSVGESPNEKWEYGGGRDAQNLNFEMAAYSDQFYKEGELNHMDGLDDSLSLSEYLERVFGNTDAAGVYADISGSWLDQARSYLESNYGENNFYDIIMTGSETFTVPTSELVSDWITFDADGDGVAESHEVWTYRKSQLDDGLAWSTYEDDGVDCSSGSFLYEGRGSSGGQSGLGAVLMTAMIVSDMRKIEAGLANLIGTIYDLNNIDSAAIIDNFEALKNGDFKGLDDHNLGYLRTFLKATHTLRSVRALFSGNGWSGYTYTVKDALAFSRWHEWRAEQFDNFRDHASDSMIEFADKLESELTLGTYYDGNEDDENDLILSYSSGRGLGWDLAFPYSYEEAYETSGDPSDLPSWANPDCHSEGHKNYIISQVMDSSAKQLRNMRNSSNDYYGHNWAVHLMGRLENAAYIDTLRCIESMCINMLNSKMHKIKMRNYKNDKKEAKEKKYEKKLEEARLQKIAQENKAGNNKVYQNQKKRRKTEQSIANKAAQKRRQSEKITEAEAARMIAETNWKRQNNRRKMRKNKNDNKAKK